jgi:hypothetical protein
VYSCIRQMWKYSVLSILGEISKEVIPIGNRNHQSLAKGATPILLDEI